MTLEDKIRRRFHKGCVEHNLLEEGDKILVALSGGKDSMTLLHFLAAQAKLYKPRIKLEAAHIIMDNIPYKTDQAYLKQFCDARHANLHILHTHFVERKNHSSPLPTSRGGVRGGGSKCFLCAWNRRKTLFEFAQANGFNKIALGHHEDDILVSLLMSMVYEGSIQTMPPKLKMENYPLTIIRPLCRVKERDIEELAEVLNYKKQTESCPYETITNRTTIANLFHTLEKTNPEVRYNLWSSMHNIKSALLP